MQNKTNSVFWLVGSVILIIMAIALTAMISQTKNASSSTDIRSRASSAPSLVFEAVIDSVDRANRTLTVKNLKFQNDDKNNLGIWEITIPSNADYSKLTRDRRVIIEAEPTTFNVASHVLKATQIR